MALIVFLRPSQLVQASLFQAVSDPRVLWHPNNGNKEHRCPKPFRRSQKPHVPPNPFPQASQRAWLPHRPVPGCRPVPMVPPVHGPLGSTGYGCSDLLGLLPIVTPFSMLPQNGEGAVHELSSLHPWGVPLLDWKQQCPQSSVFRTVFRLKMLSLPSASCSL